MRGSLIVIEGVDRTGKTTQISKLKSHLESCGRRVHIQRFPERNTVFGKQISSFLTNQVQFKDEMIHLLFSVNRWELEPEIIKLLESGTDVLLDRYSYSGTAYSRAKGLDLGWCQSPDKGLPKPDLVIYMSPKSIEELASREEFGNERYEKVEFQKKVLQVYEDELFDESWVRINASQNVEDVSKDIALAFDKFAKEFKGEAIGKL